MRARIALDSPPRISISEFVSAIGRATNGPVGTPEKGQGTIRVAVGASARLTITASAMPIEFSDPTGVAGASEIWGVSQAQLVHQSHVMLDLEGSLDPIQMAILLTQNCQAALSSISSAKAVYWDSSGQWIPGDQFRGLPASVDELFQMWVTVRTQPTQVNQSRGFTSGMHSLGHRELEVRHATEPASELVGRLTGVVQYLLQNGDVIQHKDTLGQTSNEKIRAHHVEHSEFGIQGRVLLLDYTGAKMIPAPARMSGQPMTIPSAFDKPPEKIASNAAPQAGAAWANKMGEINMPTRGGKPAFGGAAVPQKKIWPVVFGVLAGAFVLILACTALVSMLFSGDSDKEDGPGKVADAAKSISFDEAIARASGKNRRDNDEENNPFQQAAANPSKLKYKWVQRDELCYLGELIVESGGLEIKTSIGCEFQVKSARNSTRKVLHANGSSSAVAVNKADKERAFKQHSELDFQMEIDEFGKAKSYGGDCNIPFLGLPMSELLLIDIEPGQKEWTYKWSPKVITVETVDPVNMRPVVSSQVRYNNYTGKKELGNGGRARGGRDRDALDDNPFAGGQANSGSEHVIRSSQATEVVSYRVKREDKDEVVLEVELLLYSEEKPDPIHEIDLKGTYTFNKKNGCVQDVKLSGTVVHARAGFSDKSKFKFAMKHVSRGQLAAANIKNEVLQDARDGQAAKRREKLRKEEEQRIADRLNREKDRRDRQVADNSEKNRPWTVDEIIDGLQSNDIRQGRATIEYLTTNADIAIKNNDLSEALVEAIGSSLFWMSVPKELMGTWIGDKEGKLMLEAMQDSEDAMKSMRFFRAIDELEFEGKAEGLIALLGRSMSGMRASRALRKYSSDIEPLFWDVLDNSDDREKLRAALSWLQSSGTKASLPYIRRLAKRDQDPIIQSRCRSLEAFLRNRR